mgnify:CR=1 FL=1
MTIASQTSRISYVGDGVTTAFAVPFYFQANADIVVMLQNSSGAQSTLVLGTDYTLSGAGVSSGGTVTFTVAPTSTTGAVISIYRDPPVTQTTSYNNNDPFPAKSHEAALDKLTTLEQRTRDMISRSLRLPDSDPVLSSQIPTVGSRANKLLGFDTNGLPTAVLGPSFVGGTDIGAAVVSTKAVAQVTTFAGSVLYLIIGGTSAAGDTIQQTYIRGTGTGSFTDGGAVSWKPVPTPTAFGTSIGLSAIGDGTTNDQAAMQATIDAVAAAGGGFVYLTPGKTYRCIINTGVTDKGLIIKSGVTLVMNTATINLECAGAVYGVRLQSNSHITGPGTVATTVSTGYFGGEATYHTPVVTGASYSDYGTVASPSIYASPSNFSIRKLTLTNVRDDVGSGGTQAGGAILACWGGSNNGIVEDIVIPDNSKIGIAVSMDWAPLGALNSSDVPASRILFDAGTAYSLHPHDIEVRRIKIGNMSAPNNVIFGSHGIRLSGCYGIRVDGVTIAGSTYAGIFHTAGDMGFEFAPSAQKIYRYKGTSFKNVRIEAANNGWGVFCDCFADNIEIAVGGGYVPILPTQGETDILFDNVWTKGSLSASATPGFRMQNMQGGEMRNCLAQQHSVGVLVETNIDNLKIIGGVYDSNWLHGIHITSGNAAEDTLIDGAFCFSNAIGGGLGGGVVIGNAIRPTVQNCIFGTSGESFQDYGILLSSAQDAIIQNNRCHGVATSGTAWAMGTSTDYGMLALFDGNKTAAGITTKYSGINIIPYSYVVDVDNEVVLKCRGKIATANPTPATGTWTKGSIIEFTNPAAGGKAGSLCTVSGSPGTWKLFGAIDA